MNEPEEKTLRNEKLLKEYKDKVKPGIITAGKLASKYEISTARLYQIIQRQSKLQNASVV